MVKMCDKHGEADFGCSLGEDTRLDNKLEILNNFGNKVKLARATICTNIQKNEFTEKLMFISSDESCLIEFLNENTFAEKLTYSKIPDELHGYMQVNYFDKKTDYPKNKLYKYYLIDER